MKIFKTITLPILGLAALWYSSAALGGWSSSGGHLRTDAENPWWLQNTAVVPYCIDIDSTTFSASSTDVELSFQNALQYWRDQTSPLPEGGDIRLVTQLFYKVDCGSGLADLRLQFGSGTLTPEQRAHFGDRLSSIVGEAVRTDYDLVHMRGRGFIYIAPDRTMPVPVTGAMPDDLWSDRRFLDRILVHELGHVFGVGHIEGTYMDDQAPASWFKYRYVPVPSSMYKLEPLRGGLKTFSGCQTSLAAEFFMQEQSVPLEKSCIRLDAVPPLNDSPVSEYNVAVRLPPDNTWNKFGKIKLSGQALVYRSISQVVLPAGQQVFPSPTKPVLLGNIVSLVMVNFSGGTFKSHQGWEKSLLMKLTPTEMSIIGSEVNDRGQAVTVLVANEKKMFGDWMNIFGE